MKRRRKRKVRVVERAQCLAELLSACRFMAGRAFVRGYAEVRRGQPFDYRVALAAPSEALRYEYGRLFAAAVRTQVILRRGQRWTRFAVALFGECVRAGVIPPGAQRRA
jgi:hypothetical protein